MIKSINIKNIAVIEELSIEFYHGLNVITGETGAGKSILLNAIGLILGDKVNSTTIRTGAQKASVEIVFDISKNYNLKQILIESGIEVEDDLIIKREITDDSKSRCFINLNSVPNTSLKTFGEYLLDISGQHEHQSLLRSKEHISLLDSYSKLNSQCQFFYKKFHKITELQKTLDDLTENEQNREKNIELNQHAIDEIQKAQLKLNEDNELENELKSLNNYEQLNQNLDIAYNLLYHKENSIIPSTEKVLSSLEKISNIDNNMTKAYKELQEGFYILENVHNLLRSYKENIDFSPHRLEEVNQRLVFIDNLKKKYGKTIPEILAHQNKCQNENQLLSQNKEQLTSISNELNTMKNELCNLALNLSKERQKQAKNLEKQIENELKYLGMEKTIFKVEFRYVQDENSFLKISDKGVKIEENGIDRIEFLFSANPGEAPRPLSKIASGGELSRVMLAIKTILTDMDEIDTLLFDEVDAGVGGEIAFKIGKKIKNISQKRQIICITHSPQIACNSDHHFYVKKQEIDGRTKSIINKLNLDDKIHEIARMLSGDQLTEASIEHAKELINKS